MDNISKAAQQQAAYGPGRGTLGGARPATSGGALNQTRPIQRFDLIADEFGNRMEQFSAYIARMENVADRFGGTVDEAGESMPEALSTSAVASRLEGLIQHFQRLLNRTDNVVARLEGL